MRKKTIVFDCDGVIHKGYKRYKDGYRDIDYDLLWYMKELMQNYYIVVSSNSLVEQIVEFLNKDRNKDNIVGVTNEKIIGIIYIDDRGYRYKGMEDLTQNLNNYI